MRKIVATTALAVSLLGTPQAMAQDRETRWTVRSEKMTDLLNAGWSVVSHTMALASGGSSMYSFLLTRDGKYAICDLFNPRNMDAGNRRDAGWSECVDLN